MTKFHFFLRKNFAFFHVSKYNIKEKANCNINIPLPSSRPPPPLSSPPPTTKEIPKIFQSFFVENKKICLRRYSKTDTKSFFKISLHKFLLWKSIIIYCRKNSANSQYTKKDALQEGILIFSYLIIKAINSVTPVESPKIIKDKITEEHITPTVDFITLSFDGVYKEANSFFNRFIIFIKQPP